MAPALLRAAVWGWERIAEIIGPELAAGNSKDKFHRLVTPRLEVDVPALESRRYADEVPELQEMYVNFLGTAMDRETAMRAHPAFAEIIRQMTPDEARIVRGRRRPRCRCVAAQGRHQLNHRTGNEPSRGASRAPSWPQMSRGFVAPPGATTRPSHPARPSPVLTALPRPGTGGVARDGVNLVF